MGISWGKPSSLHVKGHSNRIRLVVGGLPVINRLHGGGFKYFLFSSLFGEMIQID